MTKEQKARNLYFQTDMKQTDIAAIVGISDKTLYRWIVQNNWKQMKEAAKLAPLAIVEMLYKQLYDLNAAICGRESPIPTLQEAETTRKLINSIDKLKRQASLSENIQVLMGFTTFLNKFDNDLAKQVVIHADHYLKERIGHAPLGFYEEEEEPREAISETPAVEQSSKTTVPQSTAAKKNKPAGKSQTTIKNRSQNRSFQNPNSSEPAPHLSSGINSQTGKDYRTGHKKAS